MSLSLQINRDDARPIYRQIVAQIKNQISMGRLPAGTRLPPVRQLATTLDINRLTVHNAYSELQADGWVESTVGKGTYVIESTQPLALLSSIGSETGAESVLSDIHPISQIPTLRSLAYSEPDPALVPFDEFWGMLALIKRDAPNLMGYRAPQGDLPLRVELAKFLTSERDITAMPDDILVTHGAMQGISLITEALAQPGDTVLVEDPTYLGFIHMMSVRGLNPVSVPVDAEGPDLNRLEALIRQHKPRFFYTVPTFHNPTGYSMSAARRRDLLALSRKYDLPVIEDDIYGSLSYDGPSSTPLRASDNSGRVIYISSVSKVFSPGLRVGYTILPDHLRERVLSLRRAADMFGASFTQRALAHFMASGRLRAHIRRILPVYKNRRDAMMNALQRHMPDGVCWTTPHGGFSTWVTLPEPTMRAVYAAALQHGLAFTPGDAFTTSPDRDHHLRVCFSAQPAEDLDVLIALLGNLIRQHSGTKQAHRTTPLYVPMT